MHNLRKPSFGGVILFILLVASMSANFVIYKYYNDVNKTEEQNLTANTEDEIERLGYFIKDWYADLSATYGTVSFKMYKNQLQFEGATYTLTTAADRVRAVYPSPKGERFFKIEYVTYMEFEKENGDLLCRLNYNETGETTIKIN